ncbi:hypothetical protein IEQ34_013777 [Dendrobium chrysotoxum]|uniref:Uncharacterized protein n=1 Tax=Dendrobium chrysotoxum TaxID=161865 RepID=A0AAV7GS89_DENCH|nr:hypothetical protein IEQ34_013777 [Dendrobium chrysotoxum]
MMCFTIKYSCTLWCIDVILHFLGCSFKQDLNDGYLCGTMEALNVPLADTPVSYVVNLVVTFWDGELIDAKNYTFYTGKWEAITQLHLEPTTDVEEEKEEAVPVPAAPDAPTLLRIASPLDHLVQRFN